jgi:site-specific recombinase XerD
MFKHGLRISELTSLRLSDVNLELRELDVRRCKGSDGGPHPLFNGETGAIAAWLVERAKLNPPAGCDTLFISERRKPLSRVSLWALFNWPLARVIVTSASWSQLKKQFFDTIRLFRSIRIFGAGR